MVENNTFFLIYKREGEALLNQVNTENLSNVAVTGMRMSAKLKNAIRDQGFFVKAF